MRSTEKTPSTQDGGASPEPQRDAAESYRVVLRLSQPGRRRPASSTCGSPGGAPGPSGSPRAAGPGPPPRPTTAREWGSQADALGATPQTAGTHPATRAASEPARASWASPSSSARASLWSPARHGMTLSPLVRLSQARLPKSHVRRNRASWVATASGGTAAPVRAARILAAARISVSYSE